MTTDFQKILFFAAFIFVIGCNILLSQNISVNATIDTNNVLIGDQIHLKLVAKSDKKTNIVLPQIQDFIGKIVILVHSKIDTIIKDKEYYLKQVFTITSFDSGGYVIPPLTFFYEKEGISTLFPLETNPILLNFRTVAVDTAKPIKDIKPPLEEPITWDEILPYIGIGLGALLLIAAIIYFFMKKKPKAIPGLSYDPKIPAHVAALQALKQLDNEKLWQSGKVKEYHSRLTDILRLYLERKFEIPALESITSEIIRAEKENKLADDLIEKNRNILELADLVKFAKFLPIPDENSKSMALAVEFVQATIPTETTNSGNGKENLDL